MRFESKSFGPALPMQALICFAVLGLGTAAETALAQSNALKPTFKDLPYDDDDDAQRLDVYLADSAEPTAALIYIHGGGWHAGTKNRIPQWLKNYVQKGVLSVVSVEYRFTNVAIHPAQVDDCFRAVQFVRQHAKEWNIDPDRLGVTGGSAGGHLTAYVTLHDDVADPDSKDPVERLSSRVACGISFAGPTDWGLLAKIDHQHPAYRQLVGAVPGTPADELDPELTKDASPITFATADDPPLMQIHGDADVIVPIQHATTLHDKLDSLAVENELVVIPDANHSVAGAGGSNSERAITFVKRHLLTK